MLTNWPQVTRKWDSDPDCLPLSTCPDCTACREGQGLHDGDTVERRAVAYSELS
jgi:hypothetical protein